MAKLLKIGALSCLGLTALVSSYPVTVNSIVEEVNSIVEEVAPAPDRVTPFQLKMFLKGWIEVEKNRKFLKLPEYDFGCSTLVATGVETNYTFSQYTSCLWRDAKLLPNVLKNEGFTDDMAIPIITELSFPFFGEPIRGSNILMVSSNGFITIGYEADAGNPVPNLQDALEPFNVITGWWTALTPTVDAAVYYGAFRVGLKIECRVLQWEGFESATSNNPVEFQLDICSNGEFTSRILAADDLGVSDIGLKSSTGIGESIVPFAATTDATANSAILMSPNF